MSSFNPGKAISRAFTLPSLPSIPEIKIPDPPDIVFPEPTPLPNAPLSPSLTAARQRARRNRPGGGEAPTKLELTTALRRREEDRADLIRRPAALGQTRPTLLGQ